MTSIKVTSIKYNDKYIHDSENKLINYTRQHSANCKLFYLLNQNSLLAFVERVFYVLLPSLALLTILFICFQLLSNRNASLVLTNPNQEISCFLLLLMLFNHYFILALQPAQSNTSLSSSNGFNPMPQFPKPQVQTASPPVGNKGPPPPPPPPPPPSSSQTSRVTALNQQQQQKVTAPLMQQGAPPPPPPVPPVPPPMASSYSHTPPPPPPPTLPPPAIPTSHRPVPPVPQQQPMQQKPRVAPQPPAAKPSTNEDLEKRFQFSPLPNHIDMPRHFAPPINRQYPSAKFTGTFKQSNYTQKYIFF